MGLGGAGGGGGWGGGGDWGGGGGLGRGRDLEEEGGGDWGLSLTLKQVGGTGSHTSWKTESFLG